jgi:hypothetical protein
MYGTKAPVSALMVDAPCARGVRVLNNATLMGESDDPQTAAAGAPASRCTAGDLEKVARQVLEYVNTVQ